MKALTLRHPWAFAICHWGKRVENRTWKPPVALIGQRFAIHGGKCPPKRDLEDDVLWQCRELINRFGYPSYRVDGDLKLRDVIMEGIVATARLDRVIEFGGSDDIVQQDPWFDKIPGNFGWILRDVIVLPSPIPCKGAQGLWQVPSNVMRTLG